MFCPSCNSPTKPVFSLLCCFLAVITGVLMVLRFLGYTLCVSAQRGIENQRLRHDIKQLQAHGALIPLCENKWRDADVFKVQWKKLPPPPYIIETIQPLRLADVEVSPTQKVEKHPQQSSKK